MSLYRLAEHVPVCPASCWIAPGARVIGRVTMGECVNVWFGAVVRGDINSIAIGEDTNIQDGVILHVDDDFPLVVGARVTVGHGAILHGCVIDDEVLIGMGAKVLNGAKVGRGSIVAAGAVVREGTEVPPFSLVAGLPAVVKRSLEEEPTLATQLASVRHYKDNAALYRASLEKL